MTFTHEIGHIIGGTCCGGSLKSADLLPWRLPYSIFEPDPIPLVTLWAGLIIGVLAPVAIAMILQREWMWFIANFCVPALSAPTKLETEKPQAMDEQSDARKSPFGRDFES